MRYGGHVTMTSLASLRDQILSDPEARTEYERLGPIFAVVGEMADARQSACRFCYSQLALLAKS